MVLDLILKMLEEHNVNGAENLEGHRVSEMIIKLARETEQLASKEKDIYSPVMKKWHPIAAGVSAVTLHTCYGTLLRQYINGASPHMNDTILVLQRAGKLEKVLVQMVVEDSVECEDGGKAVVREMVPYEVDTIILKLLKQWMQEKLKIGKDKLQRAKETEVIIKLYYHHHIYTLKIIISTTCVALLLLLQMIYIFADMESEIEIRTVCSLS